MRFSDLASEITERNLIWRQKTNKITMLNLTRRVFNWDPVKDQHQFRGRNNSYILEQKIADRAGYADKRKIYEELDLRTHILDRMIQLGIFDYYEVNRIIARFNEEGAQSLPFKL